MATPDAQPPVIIGQQSELDVIVKEYSLALGMLLGLLVIIVLVLSFAVFHYKSKKSTFTSCPPDIDVQALAESRALKVVGGSEQ